MTLDEKMKEVMDKVQNTANAKAVFGEPYEKDGITIIPVAKVAFSGGAGEGWGKMKMWGKNKEAGGDETGEKLNSEETPSKSMGRGFGGMARSMPIGYIKIKNGEAVFVETMDKTKLIIGGMVLTGVALVVMKMLFWRKHKCCHNHNNDKMPM
jgi:uncharacterized spore protein YtfJ